MPLLDVRRQFIQFSGRYDLVVDQTDWADNGADFFITSGQKWLDRFGHIYKAEARQYKPLKAGDWFTSVPSRSVREVWITDAEGNKWKLKKKEYKHLRGFGFKSGWGGKLGDWYGEPEYSFTSDPSKLTPGKPIYYAITSIRTVPEVDHLTIFDVYDNIVYSNQYYVDYLMLRNSIGDVYTLLIDTAHQSVLLYGVAPPSFMDLSLNDRYGAIYNSVQLTGFNNPSVSVWLYPDLSGQLIVGTVAPVGPILNAGGQLDLNSAAMTADYITATTLGEHNVYVGDDLTPEAHYANTGLIFLPPASDGMRIEILGAFQQPTLINDDDMNFWTEEEPFILVMAACRAVEISYRNKEGVSDWEAAIRQEILGMELDLAEMESNEFTQMEG